MKKQITAILVYSSISIAVTAGSHFATAGNPHWDGPFTVEVDPVATTAGGGINYSTGFEPEEGFVVGYISASGGTPVGCGGVAFPCWGHTTSINCYGGPGPVCTPSLFTPTIENLHPAGGLQHLRLTHDPTTRTNIPNYGLAVIGVDARYPRNNESIARPVAPNTVSMDIAISNPGGQTFQIQVYSNSQGLPASYMAFYDDGSIWVVDDQCGTVGVDYIYTGAYWDTTGGYQNATIAMYPCDDTINYYYAGALIYTGCVFGGSNLESVRLVGDNHPDSTMDVDNFVMTSLDECPHSCGNGIREIWGDEQCDGADDIYCLGRCIPPGQPGECTCTPICTENDPCVVHNGRNGPFMSSSGYYVYSGSSPFVSVDGCGSDFNGSLVLSTTSTTLKENLNCQASGSSGTNSDPSASCYRVTGNEPDPCTCTANPNEPILISLLYDGSTPPLGTTSIVNVRKKAACAGASVGACCDANGADRGCTDNVAEANCTGPDQIWTDQGKCIDLTCECIPDCTGRVCGDDGCGGSCGTCDDSNACNGIETCNPTLGCVPGTPLNCNDGVACNGIETCNPQTGCVAGDAPNCDDGIECTVDACNEPDGSCSHDDSDCAIPTVSQWGLVVLTIVLLVAAKVQFGRRKPA